MNAWVHPNVPGTWALSGRLPTRPFYLDTVMVCRANSPFARRLPYFGLQAINDHGLQLWFDGKHKALTLRRRARILGFEF
jgi:hypothetical protein